MKDGGSPEGAFASESALNASSLNESRPVEVTATVVAQRRHRKVLFFHYVPKKRERKKRGHRQYFTRLRIEKIVGWDGES